MTDIEPWGWNGEPEAPERSGWHWVRSGDTSRPLFWRGDDWPEALGRGTWRDGRGTLSRSDLCGSCYCGPIAMPPRVAASFRLKLLLGMTP